MLNQNHRPIAFASRTLNNVERNYTVTELECLAVIRALNKLKTYFGSLPGKLVGYPVFREPPEVAPSLNQQHSSAYLCWIYCVDESYDPALPSIGIGSGDCGGLCS
ncbi:hypothetical protein TNCV_775281 [Trichonephila clavipes]|nr:hypothetical protein TNCV_775281 [Trichonephila clavipes]